MAGSAYALKPNGSLGFADTAAGEGLQGAGWPTCPRCHSAHSLRPHCPHACPALLFTRTIRRMPGSDCDAICWCSPGELMERYGFPALKKMGLRTIGACLEHAGMPWVVQRADVVS